MLGHDSATCRRGVWIGALLVACAGTPPPAPVPQPGGPGAAGTAGASGVDRGSDPDRPKDRIALELVSMLPGATLAPPVRLAIEPEGAERGEREWTGAPLVLARREGAYRVRALGSHFGAMEIVGGAAGRVTLLVAPLSDYLDGRGPREQQHAQLVFDTTAPGPAGTDPLTWREGRVVHDIVTIEGNDLAEAARRTWETQGRHRAPTDPVFDRAMVLVGPDTESAAVTDALEALASVQRTVERNGGTKTVPAFSLHVARAEEAIAAPEFDPMALPAPPKTLRASFGKAKVSGRVDRDAFMVDMNALLPRFERCLGDAMTRSAPPRTLEIRFVLGADARPNLVSFVQNSGGHPDAALAQCVDNTLLFLKTARPEGGIVTVVAPLRWSRR